MHIYNIWTHVCKINKKKFNRKVPFKASIHHRSHMYKLWPTVHHHQENHTRYYMSQSKELNRIHNLAIKTKFFRLSSHFLGQEKKNRPRKEKQKAYVTGNSERSIRMSSLNPTHQGMNGRGEHCTKTQTQPVKKKKKNKGSVSFSL